MKFPPRKLLVLTLCVGALVVPAQSAPVKPAVSKASLPAGSKATLHFERTKVAAGAIRNDCHQSKWWIEVRDAKGKPLSGVKVALPVITKGGQGRSSENGDGVGADNSIVARLEWTAPTVRVKNSANLALTGADGRAYGRFTSGRRDQKVEIRAAGGAKASIRQVWDEADEDFIETPYRDNKPVKVTYRIRFKEGQKWVPIVGHHLWMEPTSVTIRVRNQEPGVNEVADQTDTRIFSSDAPDEAGWKNWLSWSQFGKMTESLPGVYVGYYKAHIPEGAEIDGKKIVAVEYVDYDITDDDAWDDE